METPYHYNVRENANGSQTMVFLLYETTTTVLSDYHKTGALQFTHIFVPKYLEQLYFSCPKQHTV